MSWTAVTGEAHNCRAGGSSVDPRVPQRCPAHHTDSAAARSSTSASPHAPDEQALEPALLAASTLVVAVLEQSARMGDLHHALEAGVMTRNDVHAELADLVSGGTPVRRSAEEVVVFDSTGTALEDVATTWPTYARAVAHGVGIPVDPGARSSLRGCQAHAGRVG